MSTHTNHQVSPAPPARRPELDAAGVATIGRPGSEGTTFALRLKVYLTRGRLDRRIAAGELSRSSEELALRSRQLTDPCNQQRVARDLRRVIDYADKRASGRVVSSVVIDAPVVRRGRWALTELAEQLERAGDVDPHGVVLAQKLLSDAQSPLFNRHADRTVASTVRDIREALDGRPSPRPTQF